ncbi:MAG TPA: hypothetical protein DCQ92_12450 [Verrucomicrobia subdivision 3 bacterium]|nr:hypothetical protein [Limisphaerales bacterium]
MELEYKIITSAELAGAEAAADAIECNIGKAKALKQNYSALQTQLDTIRGSIAQAKEAHDELGKGTENLTDKVKLFSGEGREMYRAVSEVTRISPLLGEALRMAMHPIGGAIAAAIVLFVKMKERMKAINDELDAMGAKAAEPTFLEGIKAKEEVLRSAADAAQEYEQHLSDIADKESSITAELTAQLALQKSIDEAHAAEASAEETLAQAKIKAAVATGKMTPAEGEAASAQVKRQAIAAAAAAKQASQQQEVGTKTEALEKLDVASDQANSMALAETYANEKARRDKNTKDFGGDDYTKKISEVQKSGDDARAALEKAYGKDAADNLIADGPTVGTPSAWAQMQVGKVNHSAGEISGLQKGRAQFEADQKSEPEFNALKISADEAHKKTDETTKNFSDLTAQLQALTDAILANRGTEKATVKTKQDVVFFDEAAQLGKGVSETQKFEQGMETRNPTASEGHAALAQAQGTTRALIEAVKEAGAAHSSALAILTEEMNRQKAETIRLAQILSRTNYALDHH